MSCSCFDPFLVHSHVGLSSPEARSLPVVLDSVCTTLQSVSSFCNVGDFHSQVVQLFCRGNGRASNCQQECVVLRATSCYDAILSSIPAQQQQCSAESCDASLRVRERTKQFDPVGALLIFTNIAAYFNRKTLRLDGPSNMITRDWQSILPQDIKKVHSSNLHSNLRSIG